VCLAVSYLSHMIESLVILIRIKILTADNNMSAVFSCKCSITAGENYITCYQKNDNVFIYYSYYETYGKTPDRAVATLRACNSYDDFRPGFDSFARCIYSHNERFTTDSDINSSSDFNILFNTEI